MCTIHIGFLYLFIFSSSNFFFFLAFVVLFNSFFFFFLVGVCVCVCSSSFGLCYLKKKLSVHTQFFFLIKMCYFFILFNENIIVNLYQLHFPSSHFFFSTKQISLLSLYFSILSTKHKWEKTKAAFGSM